MRDEGRIREKVELSLDARQVGSLVIGALVVLGVVFVLGVMVGKKLAPAGPHAPRDLLSALDRGADAGSVPLTFQQELTRPAPKAPEPAAPQKPAQKPAAQKPAQEPAAQKPAAKPSDAGAPQHADSAPAPSPAMDAQLSNAFKAAKRDPRAVPVVVVPQSGFTVQVAASQSQADAQAVLQKLRGAGLRPYLVEADVPGKGHWYRVRVGAFDDKGKAATYAHDLERETGYAGFVTAAK